MFEELLERGADVNLAERDDNFGALMRAADAGDLALAQKLIAKGANVNATGLWDRRTPLMRAAVGGHVALLQLLCDKGAALDASHNDGSTALMLAIKGGQSGTALELIARGADVNIKDGWRHDGPTALALAKGRAELEEAIRKAGGVE